MKVLELPSGMISLEYDVMERAEVRARLEAIANVLVFRHLTYAEVKVGREAFLHMADWDEPCLIAQSAAGNAILRRVLESGPGLAGASIAAE